VLVAKFFLVMSLISTVPFVGLITSELGLWTILHLFFEDLMVTMFEVTSMVEATFMMLLLQPVSRLEALGPLIVVMRTRSVTRTTTGTTSGTISVAAIWMVFGPSLALMVVFSVSMVSTPLVVLVVPFVMAPVAVLLKHLMQSWRPDKVGASTQHAHQSHGL
jgi:hypothetical protein